MKRELTREGLEAVLQRERIEDVAVSELFRLFESEPGVRDFAPDGRIAVDPRDGAAVVYNAERAKRPHDNKADQVPGGPPTDKPCLICEGRTTGIVDVAPLSNGFTFINKNLFPCVFLPDDTGRTATKPLVPDALAPDDRAQGIHLLQWTSTQHELDWHNMPVTDLKVVIDRLAALEKKLLFESGDLMPDTSKWSGQGTRGFVSIVKNLGAPVGGSLTHGHQQIVFSNAMPTQTFNNHRFKARNGVTFSEHLQRRTPAELLVKDYGVARLVVPYFMKRPLWSMLALCDTTKQHIFELSDKERLALARGWSEAARAFQELMPKMGREYAYNALVHTGPGAGLYVEFLPYTQEDGGFEKLGLWVCQESPEGAADVLRKTISR